MSGCAASSSPVLEAILTATLPSTIMLYLRSGKLKGFMVGCTSGEAAPSTREGLALLPMRRKGSVVEGVDNGVTPAEPCDALASSPHRWGLFTSNRRHTNTGDSTAPHRHGAASC